jgi:Zn-finger nucleic acid-binding protein
LDTNRDVTVSTPACPVCRKPMRSERHASLLLDRCGACDGLWFDRAELDAYLATLPVADLQVANLATVVRNGEPLPCPRCATATLHSYRAAAVVISRCSACDGIYLDGDDVRALSGGRPRYQQPGESPMGKGESTGSTVAGMAGEVVVETVLSIGVRAALGVLKGL